MQRKDLFEMALGDIQPWRVEHLEFKMGESGQRELHLWLDFTAGSVFRNSAGTLEKAYDTTWHTWRHLNFFEHHCTCTHGFPGFRMGPGA